MKKAKPRHCFVPTIMLKLIYIFIVMLGVHQHSLSNSKPIPVTNSLLFSNAVFSVNLLVLKQPIVTLQALFCHSVQVYVLVLGNNKWSYLIRSLHLGQRLPHLAVEFLIHLIQKLEIRYKKKEEGFITYSTFKNYFVQ